VVSYQSTIRASFQEMVDSVDRRSKMCEQWTLTGDNILILAAKGETFFTPE